MRNAECKMQNEEAEFFEGKTMVKSGTCKVKAMSEKWGQKNGMGSCARKEVNEVVRLSFFAFASPLDFHLFVDFPCIHYTCRIIFTQVNEIAKAKIGTFGGAMGYNEGRMGVAAVRRADGAGSPAEVPQVGLQRKFQWVFAPKPS